MIWCSPGAFQGYPARFPNIPTAIFVKDIKNTGMNVVNLIIATLSSCNDRGASTKLSTILRDGLRNRCLVLRDGAQHQRCFKPTLERRANTLDGTGIQ